jgi:hypothetical protein
MLLSKNASVTPVGFFAIELEIGAQSAAILPDALKGFRQIDGGVNGRNLDLIAFLKAQALDLIRR